MTTSVPGLKVMMRYPFGRRLVCAWRVMRGKPVAFRINIDHGQLIYVPGQATIECVITNARVL